MRNWLLFILILASKFIYACGFYPTGEDARMSLFNPHAFGFHLYSDFYYSSNAFYHEPHSVQFNEMEPNIKLWFDYCRGKVDLYAVKNAIYTLTEIDEHSPNEMIQYLYEKKDHDALDYLRFAKSCEFLNSWQNDPWERKTLIAEPMRSNLINKALDLSAHVKNQDLKRRYAFLAIRLAWYNRDYQQVKLLFDTAFGKTKNKDIVYYWSLYFKTFAEEDRALANFELAQVFANAPDKRFVCHQQCKKGISIEQMLSFAETKEEKANVYLLAAIEKHDKALPYIQKVYELNPEADGLAFLLLREINKIEDFVLTPSYTLFQPSLSYNRWSDESKQDSAVIQTLQRAEQDRMYARKVVQFISSVNLRKTGNLFFWQISKAYVQLITKDYYACLTLVTQLENSAPNKELANQLQIIRAIAVTAQQPYGKAIILTEVQSALLSNQKNGQFIFAIGKELETLGNTTDAVLLYSKLMDMEYQGDNAYVRNTVYWRIPQFKGNTYFDYYTDYFDYADAVYTPEQIQRLIDDIQKHQNETDRFLVFKYENVKAQLPRLYDLLGTKYIRQNKSETALVAYEKAGQHYWNRAYTAWDDQASVLTQNPFYTLKYTPRFIEPCDTIRLNKYSITKQLIYYLQRAEDKSEIDRDYYYFLVANAYYNMSHEGNATIMRRIGRWSGHRLSPIEDEQEFRQANLAKQYYLLAKQYAQTPRFQALCLRMAALCERHKIEYKYIVEWGPRNLPAELAANTYYLDLQSNYPDYYEDLTSNCNSFQSYFNGRR
ncbi:MAG: hypothetical protein HYZ44_15330 [Bacteroidetes bacterium]|nr:hypothetical protein [Bacteroidota bacterium]